MKKITFLMMLLPLLIFSACSDSSTPSVPHHSVNLYVTLPEDVMPETVSNVSLTFRNVTSGTEQQFSQTDEISVIPGLYDISYEGVARLVNGAETHLRATQNSVNINADFTLRLEPFSCVESGDLIIAEIFFTGTLNPSGNSYKGDDYIKLYNNSDKVIYADGLAIVESKFNTTQKYDYTPDIMNEAVTVDAIYVIPGSGHDHPVQPGEYFLLADTGIDHRELNPNSFDLSAADFEWYDVSTVPSQMDIDSPTVPNLDKWYCYTKTYFFLHDRGLKSYGIARIPVDKETYLKDYLYKYSYNIVSAAGTFPMSDTGYRIPNEWVVDWVNCSLKSSYAWTVSAPVIDMGWTGCGTINNDKTRFFHSVRRKLLYVNEQGNPVFKDTNNSTADFNTNCIASEIELSGSVMDQAGNKCATITYDGLTPIQK